MNMQHVTKIGTTVVEITGKNNGGFNALHYGEKIAIYPARNGWKVVERNCRTGRFQSVHVITFHSHNVTSIKPAAKTFSPVQAFLSWLNK